MSERHDVAVIGGGVVGLAAAYSLAKRGARVVLVERAGVGSGASAGNAGWISPVLAGPVADVDATKHALRSLRDRDSPFYLAPRLDPALARWLWCFWRRCNAEDWLAGLHATSQLALRTFELYDALAADGVNFNMWTDGLVLAFLEPETARRWLSHFAPLDNYGYQLPDEPLVDDEFRALEPLLSPVIRAGFLIRSERHVNPSSLTKGLATRLGQLGAEVREHVTVTAFEQRDGRVLQADELRPDRGGQLRNRQRYRQCQTDVAARIPPSIASREGLQLLRPHHTASPSHHAHRRKSGCYTSRRQRPRSGHDGAQWHQPSPRPAPR